jgi:lysophospholipase L1-like esterase
MQNLDLIGGPVSYLSADAADLRDDLHPNGDGYERIGQRWHAFAG